MEIKTLQNHAYAYYICLKMSCFRLKKYKFDLLALNVTIRVIFNTLHPFKYPGLRVMSSK